MSKMREFLPRVLVVGDRRYPGRYPTRNRARRGDERLLLKPQTPSDGPDGMPDSGACLDRSGIGDRRGKPENPSPIVSADALRIDRTIKANHSESGRCDAARGFHVFCGLRNGSMEER